MISTNRALHVAIGVALHKVEGISLEVALRIADDVAKELEDNGWMFDNSKVVTINSETATTNRFKEDSDG